MQRTCQAWQRFFGSSSLARKHTRPSTRNRTWHPRVEALEDRTLLTLSATTWTPIGPAPISVAPQFNGPVVAGRVNVAAADPSNANVMYIGTTGGGIWKTADWLDASPVWTPLTDNEPSLVINEHCLVVFPSNPQIIYAAASGPGGGVLKSTDGGATWSFLGNSIFNYEGLNAIVVSPASANTVYVAVADNGTPGGLWRSLDGGLSWKNVTSTSHIGAVTDVVMDPTNPSVLYASFTNPNNPDTNGIYKTTNGGNNWTLLNNGLPSGSDVGGDLIRLAIAPSAPATVYASVFTQPTADSNFPTLYKTTNGGGAWTPLTVPPSQEWRPWHALLGVDPSNPQVVYVNGNGPLYRSADGGSTWQQVYLEDPVMVHFDASGAVVMVGDRGIYRWTGSGAFQNKQGNLQITLFYNLALDSHNQNAAYGIAQDHFQGLKYAGSSIWTYTGAGTELAKILVDPSNSSTVYDYDPLGQFFLRSDNAGASWQQKITGLDTSGFTDFYTDQSVQNAFVIDPSNSQRLLVADQQVFETINRAEQWNQLPNSPDLSSGQVIRALAISRSNGQTVYAGSSDGRFFATCDDGATAWHEQDGGLPGNGILAIQVDPSNPLRVLVALHGSGVWMTTNGGVNWTDLTHGSLPPTYPAGTPLAVDWRYATPVLYFGTYRGLYRSLDLGTTWTHFGQTLPNTWVTDLEQSNPLDLLAAGTWGRGAFEIQAGGPATHFSVTIQPSATAGSSFTITVQALDAAGTPSTAYTGSIHFASSDLSPTLPSDYTFTGDDYGSHTFAVTLTTAGSQTVTVTDTASAAVAGSATVQVGPAAATHLAIAAPTGSTAGSPFDVTVTARDHYGNIDSTYTGTVHFGSNDMQAVLPALYTFTTGSGNDNGSHTFSSAVTLKTAGSETVTATDNAALTGTATIQVSAALATRVRLAAPPTVTAGSPFSLTVQALDPYDNPASTYTGTIHFTSSDVHANVPGNYTFTTGSGGDNGSHTFPGATLDSAGSQDITVADTGSFTDMVTLQVRAAAATHLVLTAPASATAGVAFGVTVAVFDDYTNQATGYTGTIHFTSNDPQASFPSGYTFTTGSGGDNGAHTFPSVVTLKTAGSHTVTATGAASLSGGASVVVSPASATHLAVSAPASSLAGTAFDVTVTALDPFGNPDPAYAGTVQLTSDDAQATLPDNYTFTTGSNGDHGTHTFVGGVTLQTPGTHSVRAQDGHLLSGSAAVALPLLGPLVTLTSSPSSVVFGQPLTLTVTVLSANGSGSTPTGTVVFHDGGTVLGSAPLDGSGLATFTALLAPGGHALSAVFSGDGTFATALSATLSQVVADQPLTEVTGQVSVSLGRIKRRGRRTMQIVTVATIGGQVLEGPLSLVLDGLKRTIKVSNPAGFTRGSAGRRSPYVNMLPDGVGVLEPGQTASVTLTFSNPGGGGIRFRLRVLAGVGPR
jgi:hypothetical protein